MSNINKTSFAATISEFVDNVEKNVLKPKETLSSKPASFIGTFSSTLGKISAYSFYQMLMSKREITPSTAIMSKSLLRHLKSDELNSIYASPSEAVFIISYPEDELIKSAIATGKGDYKLTINKDAVFYIGNLTFLLDYNINIFISKYKNGNETRNSIYATFDTDDNENGDLFPISNPFITSRNDITIDNKKHFTMYLPIKQYTRTRREIELTGESKSIAVSYDNDLIGFNVLYRKPGEKKYIKVSSYLEGDLRSDGVSYSVNNTSGSNSIRLSFSKIPGAFNPANGTLKVVVYTTLGEEGRYSFSDTDEDIANADINLYLNQDLSDVYQEAIINITPNGSIQTSKSTGGYSSKSLEDIRNLVINKQNDTIITPSTLSKAATDKGFDSFKTRQDLLSFEYTLTSFLTDKKNNVIPTKTIDVSYLYSDIAINLETGSRMITPSDVFRHNNSSGVFDYIPFSKLDSYTDFYNRYKKDPMTEYCFPYFIRIQNGNDISIGVFDESIDVVKSTSFKYLSSNILDKASIVSTAIYRNPLSLSQIKDKNGNVKYLKDFYSIIFTVNTSSVIVDHLKNLSSIDDPYVKFKIVLRNKTDTSKYIANVDLSNCTFLEDGSSIRCICYLETNSMLLSSNKISLINNSVSKLPYTSTPYSFYYIDGEIDIDFTVIFKESNNELTHFSKYDEYLTDDEKADKYYIGVIYSVEEVVFSKNMGDFINMVPDVKLTQPVYKVAENDIPDTYNEPVYKMENGIYTIEEIEKILVNDSTSITKSYVKLHDIGDIKKENDGRVGSFNTLGSSQWKWSDDTSDNNPGIFNDGSVLGENSIFTMIQWNGLVIFGGEGGRIGCLDINTPVKDGVWYDYNTNEQFRRGSTKYIIKNNGDAMGFSNIRGFEIINVSGREILVAYGDNGRVCSCDLSTNTWRKYSGEGGNSVALIYNNGISMGDENIYASSQYVDSNNNIIIVFGGGSGRVCSLNANTVTWFSYNYSNDFSTNNRPFSNGEVRNFKSILTISKYMDSVLYFSGIDGIVSLLDITSGSFTLMNNGSVIGYKTVYASTITNGYYVIAGKTGKVSSYNISKNVWNTFDQGESLSSNGSEIGNVDIFSVIGYDINVLFGGEFGRTISYNVVTNEWTSYNQNTEGSLSNDGSFIKNSISDISFDSTESNIIFFAGKSGNIVYKYLKGETILDNTGKPIVEKPAQQVGFIKHVPSYSRIYAIESEFLNVISSYEDSITKIKTMSTIFPDGCSLNFNTKNTSGSSTTFRFFNKETNVEELLDSLSISIHIGVKFIDSVIDENKTHLVVSIKEKILEYVSNVQNNRSSNKIILSIDEMLNYVKNRVPNIKYFEKYKINNYEFSKCQTIYYDKEMSTRFNEYLSIKNIIDEDNSDIQNRNVTFKPDITVDIL